MDEGFPVLRIAHLLLALWGAFALVTPAFAQVEFRPPGGGFRLEFPGPFHVHIERTSTRFGNTRGTTASLERADGVKFYAQYMDYPPAAAQEGPQRLLDGLTLGRTVKGTVRAGQRFLFDGNPAQRETVDWDFATRPVIVALDVLRGLRLYSIFCIVDRGRENSRDVQDFIGSFALLPL